MACNGKTVAIVVVGATGTGKSTVTRNLIDAMSYSQLHIYDVNAEYDDLYSLDFVNVSDFMKRVKNCENSLVVFEEATMFFNNKSSSSELTEMLVRKRHKKNNFIFCFHSFRSIPRYIFDFVDFIYIKKTNDTYSKAREKIDDDVFLKMFEKVNASENNFETMIYSTK